MGVEVGGAVVADGGALKIDCCNSVAVTAPAGTGARKVPSSFEMVSDFPLAY